MKKVLFRILAVTGLMSLASSLWAAPPSGSVYSSAPFITTTQSTTISGSFYSNYDYYYGDDYITGYDIYIDGVLASQVGNLYSSYEYFETTLAGNTLAQGTHSVEVYVYTYSGDSTYSSTSFTVGDLGTAYTINLQSVDGYYVCTEGGGGREVVANRTGPGAWETFTLHDVNGGSLESGDAVFIQGPHGQFLCAEGSGGQNVVANRYYPGPWEQFTFVKLFGTGTIGSGDQIAIQVNNGQYWCAENGGGSVVNANRNAIGPWEEFTLTLQ
jgi:hypothetical protein